MRLSLKRPQTDQPRKPLRERLAEARAKLAAAREKAARIVHRRRQARPLPAIGPDPIHAAIEAHRAAFDAWDRLDRETETLLHTDARYKAALPACNAAEVREVEAFRALLATRATTVEGLRRLIVYLPEAARNTAPTTAECDQQRALAAIRASLVGLDDASRIVIEPRIVETLPPVADLLASALTKEWAAYMALPTDDTLEAEAARDKGYERVHAVVAAIERLPAIPTSLSAKALALSWIDSSETVNDQKGRDEHATDGKLGFDILAIVTGKARAEPERAAFAGLVEPKAVAAGLDLATAPMPALHTLHQMADTIERISYAFTCQPRCIAEEHGHSVTYNAAGEFADWLVTFASFVMEAAEREAQRREPEQDDDDRLTIVASRAINNGDRDELHAFIRDLQAKARRQARG